MGVLTRDYFIQNKWFTLSGALCGLAIALLFGLGLRSIGWMLIWLPILPLFNCPLTMKTLAGRIWWEAYCGLMICLAVISLIRLPHPLAWADLILCAGLGVIIVCLRWRPPTTPPT